MPAKRMYNIKGTNDYLVLSVIFFFLCLWAIKDAWYPSDKVLKKHPREVAVSFSVAGSVEKVFVKEGDSVGESQLLAKLRQDRVKVEFEEAKSAYTAAKKKHAMMDHAAGNAKKNGVSEEGVTEIDEELASAKKVMEDAYQKVKKLKLALDSAEVKATVKGKIKKINISTHTIVEAGETVMTVNPKDHFYLFNKSLAIFSFFAFWVFLVIHILLR
ncbi:MAG: biotin/lipoyl-binding protein [Kiritimatiellaceae bacterium]|nr:biotin/lipoyl-binding protein [Kiritimatiellaceae bacterium]